VTDNVGSMGFFLLIAIWTLVWLAWNTVGPQELRFDPAPAFVPCCSSATSSSSTCRSPLIGQNLQDRQSELRLEIVRRLERIERGAA